MLKTALLLTSLRFVTLGSLHAADARDRLSPYQRVILESKSPPPAKYRFSFDLPAGPQFTEAEKEAQRELGKGVMPMVMKAFESGGDSVRIPPGDYRKRLTEDICFSPAPPLRFRHGKTS